MRAWSYYDAATGLFTGGRYIGDFIEQQFARGLHAIEGIHDPKARRIDLDTGLVVEWQMPPPSAELVTAKLAADARAHRDRLLALSDWVAIKAGETGQPVPPLWLDYRQALRELPEQPGFPNEINWPAVPA